MSADKRLMEKSMIDQLIQSIPTDMYIGGEWTPSSDGEQFDVRDPATEAVGATVANRTPGDGGSAGGVEGKRVGERRRLWRSAVTLKTHT